MATFVNCFHILATLRNFSLLANFATFGISKLNLIFGIFWQLVQDLGTFQNFSHFCHILVTFATLLHFLPHLGTFCHIFAIFGSFPQFLTTIGIFWQLLSCFCNFWTFWHILATRATFDIFCNFKHLWADFVIFLVTFGYFQLSIFWPLFGNFRQLFWPFYWFLPFSHWNSHCNRKKLRTAEGVVLQQKQKVFRNLWTKWNNLKPCRSWNYNFHQNENPPNIKWGPKGKAPLMSNW